jgi:hypothetical protein
MLKEEYHEFECCNCSVKVLVQSTYNKECSESVGVKCPLCKGYLGDIMADIDVGYELLGTKPLL